MLTVERFQRFRGADEMSTVRHPQQQFGPTYIKNGTGTCVCLFTFQFAFSVVLGLLIMKLVIYFQLLQSEDLSMEEN